MYYALFKTQKISIFDFSFGKKMRMNFDDLVKALKNYFDGISTNRPINATYTMPNILMCGFALFSLKDSSLLKFISSLKDRATNLTNIFHITQTPSDTALRTILDEIPTGLIKSAFTFFIQLLDKEGVLKDYKYLGRLLIPLDGTQYFKSNEIHCENCLTKEHQNGTVTYHHNAVGACIVHPEHKEVFPIGIEDIAKQDGQTKNDCETNAAKRLIPQIINAVPKTPLLLGGDAIYANGPMIRLIKDLEITHGAPINFIFSVQPLSHEYLFLQFNRLLQAGEVKSFTTTSGSKQYVTKYANGLILNGANHDILVNFLYFEEHDLKKGTCKVFTWITDITITLDNHVKLVKAGRARWKIENETFNTLKNQGYQFEHNFGHGKKYLAANFSVLMLLAFLFDQIQQRCNMMFRLAKLKAGTFMVLWEKIRHFFDLTPLPSMQVIYKLIAKKIKLSIQFNL